MKKLFLSVLLLQNNIFSVVPFVKFQDKSLYKLEVSAQSHMLILVRICFGMWIDFSKKIAKKTVSKTDFLTTEKMLHRIEIGIKQYKLEKLIKKIINFLCEQYDKKHSLLYKYGTTIFNFSSDDFNAELEALSEEAFYDECVFSLCCLRDFILNYPTSYRLFKKISLAKGTYTQDDFDMFERGEMICKKT